MFYRNYPKTATRAFSAILFLMLIAVWGCGKSNNAGLLQASDVTGTELGTTTTASILLNDVVGDPIPENAVAGNVFKYNMIWDGEERVSFICLPSNYDTTTTHALMLVLHGRGTDGVAKRFAENHSNLRQKAAARGFVLVFPRATTNTNEMVTWNVWGNTDIQPADDVGFLKELITQLKAESAIDAARVFISGFSNGGAMTQRFAAEEPNEIRAAASVCHTSGYRLSTSSDSVWVDLPPPAGPVSILLIRGGADHVIPSDGTESHKYPKFYRTPDEQLEYWLTPTEYDGIADSTKTVVSEDDDPNPFTKRIYADNNKAVGAWFSTNLTHHWRDAKYNVGFDINTTVLSFFENQSNSNQQ